jgi:hypothetical protein
MENGKWMKIFYILHFTFCIEVRLSHGSNKSKSAKIYLPAKIYCFASPFCDKFRGEISKFSIGLNMKKSVFLLFLFIFLFSADAFSAVKTWDGGGANGNWTTAANWVGDVAPVAGDDLFFPATSAQFMTTHNYTSTTFNSITFEGGAYTVDGSLISPINLRGLNVGGGTQTINIPMSLSGTPVFTAAAGSVTTIAALTVGANGLTIEGDGNFGVGIIGGSGAITKNGLGATLLAGTLFGFTGAINLNNGIFVVDANIPNSNVTVNSPTTGGGTLGFSGFGGTGTVGNVNVTQGAVSAGTLQSPTGILNTKNLTFTANGNYACKIGGTSSGANGHDQLNVTGTVSLNNARLAPIPWGTFRPAIGDTFVILKNDGTDAVNGTFLNAPEGAVFGGALNTAFRITYHGGDGNDVAITTINKAAFDFDSDGKTDISIFRPTVGQWWYYRSSDGGNYAATFGVSTDKLVPGDYTGDGKTDIAVWRPSTGEWFILRSEDGSYYSFPFGTTGDIPSVGDFDGDGRADTAVFRPTDTNWYIRRSLDGGTTIQQFGASNDVPAVADYDGDGLTDIAIWRASVGEWWIQKSSDSSVIAFQFGNSADKPVQGDYTGDGKADVAIFRPAIGEWFILRSEDFSYYSFPFGTGTDLPAPGDFDGDGKFDAAVFRPSDTNWYVQRSTAGTLIQAFGQTGDKPVPGAFIP